MDKMIAAIVMVEKLTKQQRLMMTGKILASILWIAALPTTLIAGSTVGLLMALGALLVDSGIVIYGIHDWINSAQPRRKK